MAIKRKNLRLPTLKESVAIAAVLALVGFFSLHVYYPPLGVIGNAMNGAIHITSPCPDRDAFAVAFDTDRPPAYCGIIFPYRWMLIGLVLFVAVCGFAGRLKPRSI